MKHTVIDYYVIHGEWTDGLGNYGEFGCGFYSQPNDSFIAENTGFWSWYDYATGAEPVAGQFPKFTIYLQNEDGHTDGTWSSSYTHWPPDEIGALEGHRIW